MLGWHWLAQVEGADAEALASLGAVRDLLSALPRAFGLRAVAPPTVRHVDGGVAGVVLLAESHAAVHTHAGHGTVFVDVFSCRPIESTEVAEALVREHLGGTVTARVAHRASRPAAV